eukprot:1979702-Rhodomonas_salina.1
MQLHCVHKQQSCLHKRTRPAPALRSCRAAASPAAPPPTTATRGCFPPGPPPLLSQRTYQARYPRTKPGTLHTALQRAYYQQVLGIAVGSSERVEGAAEPTWLHSVAVLAWDPGPKRPGCVSPPHRAHTHSQLHSRHNRPAPRRNPNNASRTPFPDGSKTGAARGRTWGRDGGAPAVHSPSDARHQHSLHLPLLLHPCALLPRPLLSPSLLLLLALLLCHLLRGCVLRRPAPRQHAPGVYTDKEPRYLVPRVLIPVGSGVALGRAAPLG